MIYRVVNNLFSYVYIAKNLFKQQEQVIPLLSIVKLQAEHPSMAQTTLLQFPTQVAPLQPMTPLQLPIHHCNRKCHWNFQHR